MLNALPDPPAAWSVVTSLAALLWLWGGAVVVLGILVALTWTHDNPDVRRPAWMATLDVVCLFLAAVVYLVRRLWAVAACHVLGHDRDVLPDLDYPFPVYRCRRFGCERPLPRGRIL